MASDEQILARSGIDDLVQQLHIAFQSDYVNTDDVSSLLAAYKSNPNDWKKYAIFDPYRYTRNLVDSGNGRFNLMVLCWGAGHGSSVHDHSDAHCFVKVLEGQLKETIFDWPSSSSSPDVDEREALTQTAVNYYDKDGVTYMNDSMGLHRVENASYSKPAVSLHLYSPPFNSCQTFDEKTGMARTVRMTFWSDHGRRTSSADIHRTA